MSNFRALTLEDEKEVSEILRRFKHRDIHLDPRYLRLFQEYLGQKAVYFHYRSAGGEFLLAFFERILPEIAPGIVEKDLLSPWYFGGPVHTFAEQDAAKEEYKKFCAELDAYCLQHGIISQFQRLNPVLKNHELYTGDPGLLWDRKQACIDLRKDMETIRKGYDYKVRKNIKRARAGGLRVVRDSSPEAVRRFISVYTAAMDRIKVGKFYYFNDAFFVSLFKQLGEEAQLFTVYAGEEVAQSQLVVGNGVILHDYLRASYPQYLKLRPNDFVLDEIISWAKQTGYQEYGLGGGNSSSEQDPQYKFKAAFSPLHPDFYVYKKVHNREAYAKRCAAGGKSETELLYEKADPFPEYKTS